MWGTIDPDNQLSLYDAGGSLIGTIVGTDLIAAITTASLDTNSAYYDTHYGAYTVYITISVPSGFSSVRIAGAHDKTFEYSNIVTTPSSSGAATPAPATAPLTLFAIGLLGLTRVLRRKTGKRK